MDAVTAYQISAGAYGAAWFVAAKILYGRWRIAAIERPTRSRACKDHREYGGGCCFIRQSNNVVRPEYETCFMAMVAAIFWPLLAVGGLIRYAPPPAPGEIEAQWDALQARLAELEEELEL